MDSPIELSNILLYFYFWLNKIDRFNLGYQTNMLIVYDKNLIILHQKTTQDASVSAWTTDSPCGDLFPIIKWFLLPQRDISTLHLKS